MAEEKDKVVLKEKDKEDKKKEPEKKKEEVVEVVEEETVEFREFPEGTEVIEDDDVTDAQATKLLDEMQAGKRFFEIEGVGTLYLRNPTVEETQEAGFVYSKSFNKAILEGIETSDILEQQLIEKGLLEDMDSSDSELNKLRKNLMKNELLLRKQNKDDKSKRTKKLAFEVADTRQKIFDSQIKRQNLLSNSAEQRADEIRSGYLISRVTYNSDTDERIWDTYMD